MSTAMAMLPKQRKALLAAVETFEREALFKHRESLCFDHALHGSMDGFSKAFCQRFGALCAEGRSVLLLHAGASMTDRRDELGLPVQCLGLTGPRVVLIVKVLGSHRLVGEKGPAMDHVARVLEATAVGKVLVEPWPDCTG